MRQQKFEAALKAIVERAAEYGRSNLAPSPQMELASALQTIKAMRELAKEALARD